MEPAEKPGMNLLTGRRILVTAGPTWVRIDAVRHIGNVSSGRTGLIIARALRERGAELVVLLGPGRICPTPQERADLGIEDFETFDELHAAVRRHVGSHACDAMVHSAAVSDYRPVSEEQGKLSSDSDELVLRLRPTPKIVDEVKPLDPNLLLVKFKLEVGRSEAELLAIAARSRVRSAADLIVANDLTSIGAGRHRSYLLDEGGLVSTQDTTEALAIRLADELAQRLHNRPPRAIPPPPPGL